MLSTVRGIHKLTLGNTSKVTRLATRNYIRPHYYNNKDGSLSSALKSQRNPFNQFGAKINNLPPNAVLWSVIGINVGVYGLWQFSINTYKSFGDDSRLNFMVRNFMCSPKHIESGRIHTLLTSAFSHKSLDHLGLNMLVLYTMGQGVIEFIGASRFLLLYAGAGITASLVAVGYRKYVKPMLEKGYRKSSNDSSFLGSLGASGNCHRCLKMKIIIKSFVRFRHGYHYIICMCL